MKLYTIATMAMLACIPASLSAQTPSYDFKKKISNAKTATTRRVLPGGWMDRNQ